jgi:hypothetical protein
MDSNQVAGSACGGAARDAVCCYMALKASVTFQYDRHDVRACAGLLGYMGYGI